MGSVLLNGMTRLNTSTERQNASIQFVKVIYNDYLYCTSYLALYAYSEK